MAISQLEYARRVQAGRDKLYRTAFCYVKNEQDALDIVGDAVYQGLRSLHQLRQVELFDTWMTRIVINTALSHLRRQGTRPRETQEPEAAERVPAAPLPVEASLDLYAALDRLDAGERTLVILHYFQGRPFREIGDILDLPEPTVKSKLYRTLKKLRQQLSS